MRLTLRRQITAAFICFGLIPASIVAWSAYQSTDEFKEKQRTILKLAANTISERVARPLDEAYKSAQGPDGFRKLSEPEVNSLKNALKAIVLGALTDHGIQIAQLIIVDPDNRIMLRRTESGWYETNFENTELESRYSDVAKEAANKNWYLELEGSSESSLSVVGGR